METKVLTAHVPIDLARRVDEVAERLERSRGWIVKQALSAWIEQEDERRRLTLEALADVDAMNVVDHRVVEAWAESLGTDEPAANAAIMRLSWTAKAVSDLARLNDFLAPVNPRAAAHAIQSLVAAPAKLTQQPRLGERLDEFEPREVRRILVGKYEIRYEIASDTIYVLRIWHTREDR